MSRKLAGGLAAAVILVAVGVLLAVGVLDFGGGSRRDDTATAAAISHKPRPGRGTVGALKPSQQNMVQFMNGVADCAWRMGHMRPVFVRYDRMFKRGIPDLATYERVTGRMSSKVGGYGRCVGRLGTGDRQLTRVADQIATAYRDLSAPLAKFAHLPPNFTEAMGHAWLREIRRGYREVRRAAARLAAVYSSRDASVLGTYVDIRHWEAMQRRAGLDVI